MKVVEKTLEYHELLMVLNDTSIFGNDTLPNEFNYEFYKPGDEIEWSNIHVSTGEFMCIEEGIKYFHDFYDSFINELSNRCIFIVNSNNEKVATATISLLENKEYGYDAVVDWVAIKKEYQGMHLSKPLINRFIKLANELGHEKLLLHTQTHTWLAAKLYLDVGFEPFNVKDDIKGWQILKTITNHPKLNNIESINTDDMYFDVALKVVEELDKIHGTNYEYSIWHKNGRHDVDVNCNGVLYQYKYYLENNKFWLEESNQINIVDEILKELINRSNDFVSKTKGTPDEYNVYEDHIKYVYKYSVMIAQDKNIDIEIVKLCALLHDISMTDINLDRERHNEYGAIIAEELLKKYNYPIEKIELIKKCILNHSSKRKEYRTTIYENILVNADAMAHFDSILGIYSLAHNVIKLNEEESIKFVKDKFTRDYIEIDDDIKNIIEENYNKIMNSNCYEDLVKIQFEINDENKKRQI